MRTRSFSAMRLPFCVGVLLLTVLVFTGNASAQHASDRDFLRKLQFDAIDSKVADWGHWGSRTDKFSQWTNHSNRLIPVYTFGIDLQEFKGSHSAYRDKKRLIKIYGELPAETLNPDADYFDQTDIYRLQKQAVEQGKKYIFLVVFDGMDWQTTRAASIYKTQSIGYQDGRGSGLHFQDYRGADTDFGWMVTSPHDGKSKHDVDGQAILTPGECSGGYCRNLGGEFPWDISQSDEYLLGRYRKQKHTVTDSAASATSMNSGVKTYNAAINYLPNGEQVAPIARWLQREKQFSIAVVTSVPISHATPACTYANNVTRNDYQDISRDLLGLPSVSHREQALPGVDVLIGCGYGVDKEKDKSQGRNFVPGNRYLAEEELESIKVENGGAYLVAQRESGESGAEVLAAAARKAVKGDHRLLGFFGAKTGHLPFQTADGNYDPTRGAASAERYKPEDISENPTLADMTRAALTVAEHDEEGFWMMVEAGDVDWANHNNNIDDSIGAVLSGDDAVRAITDWVEQHKAWQDTALIVTADHGHYFVLDDPEILLAKKPEKTQRGKAQQAKPKRGKAKSTKDTQPSTAQKSAR